MRRDQGQSGGRAVEVDEFLLLHIARAVTTGRYTFEADPAAQ